MVGCLYGCDVSQGHMLVFVLSVSSTCTDADSQGQTFEGASFGLSSLPTSHGQTLIEMFPGECPCSPSTDSRTSAKFLGGSGNSQGQLSAVLLTCRAADVADKPVDGLFSWADGTLSRLFISEGFIFSYTASGLFS